MSRQKLIYGIVIFFITCSSSFSLSLVPSMELHPNNNLSVANPPDENTTPIGYDLIRGSEEIEYYSSLFNQQSLQTVAPPYLGSAEASDTMGDMNLELSYVFPPDNRTKITSTSSFPWRTICKLYITAADDTLFIGSGAMLDEYHILTCGHCVYIHDHGGWVDDIEVIPGKSGSYTPYGSAYATYFRTYTGWTQSEMVEHDWAVVTLDRLVGEQTGWMGRMTRDPTDSVYTGILNTAGYPSDLDSGEYMYFTSDNGEDANQYNHWFWMDTAPGQSGSPVWLYDGSNRFIVSINAYEYEYGTYANFGTRLDQNKFDQINTWLAADSPPDNPNGEDPSAIISISVVAGVVVVLIIALGAALALGRSTPDLQIFEPREEKYENYKMKKSSPNAPPSAVQLGFCPSCGTKIMQNEQRFCWNCGFEF
jgi:V8-like Glu-specific endopeptidase